MSEDNCLHCKVAHRLKDLDDESDARSMIEALAENIADIVSLAPSREIQDEAIDDTLKYMTGLFNEIVTGTYKDDAKFYPRQESLQ